MCAISLSIIGPFIGVETPVTVIQMLWINMIMDTLAGLAFATSISALFTIVLLFISLKRKIGSFGGKSIVLGMIKSLISGLIMAVVTLFSYNTIANILGSGFIKEVITLALSVGIGAIVYGTSIIILKVDEVNIILEKVKGKLNRK